MKQKIRLNHRQQVRLSQKMLIGLSVSSISGLCLYLTFLFFHADRESSLARINLIDTDPINNGEVICAYTWEQKSPSTAEIGPQGLSVSSFAHCIHGGINNSLALSTQSSAEGINLVLPSTGLLEDGIDVSLDYMGSTQDGDFLSHGKNTKFGIRDGKLFIQYRTKKPDGKIDQVRAYTDFEIPKDRQIRNYRFIYNPTTGKGTLLVDQTTIWQHAGHTQSVLVNSSDDLIIGNNIHISETTKPVIDNFIVRKCGIKRLAPIELLAFSAERKDDMVMISWFTASEKETDSYIIERSFDTKNYEVIGSIKASGHSTSLQAYALLDKRPGHGVNYYRLALSNHSSRSGWLPVIALRYKPADETTTTLSTGR